MLTALIVLIGGLMLLTYGADRFVVGAAATAANLGVPSLLVGLVIVGFATSAPEMLVSAVAALNQRPEIGIGNAIGSNITNIALVIGATALWTPLAVGSTVVRREFPILFLVLAVAVALMWDLHLGIRDGAILLIGLVVMIGLTVWLGRHAAPDDPLRAEIEHREVSPIAPLLATLWLLFGLALLLLGSRLVVDGAVDIAAYLGLSDIVIGLTVVAVGTSLPELAASIMSAVKNEPDIALGNVIGSNMFNALGVLAMPALLAPGTFDRAVMNRDVPCMIGLSVALLLMCRARRGRRRIGRLDGAVLLGAFVAYQVLLFADGS
ncbi:MAG: calcium/sodium antiporter [Gammaproteobacteria bacterium]